MCDPTGITEAGIGLSLASAAAGFAQQQQTNSAIQSARDSYNSQYAAITAAGQKQQQDLQSQRQALFNQSVANDSQPNRANQTQQIQDQLTGQYQTATAGTLADQQKAGQGSSQAQGANPNNETSNKLINSAYQQEAQKLADYTNQQGAAKAALDANATNLVDTANFNTNQGNALNLNNSAAQGYLGATQTELGLANEIYKNNVAAAQAGGGLFGGLSTILGGAGKVAGASINTFSPQYLDPNSFVPAGSGVQLTPADLTLSPYSQ
jgi:hypothetical protein